MKINKFEELDIWKRSIEITKNIYELTSENKFIKDYGLQNQIRRAIVSISSNIVEGFERNNNNEFIRFLKIAKGSCGETRNQLYIALKIDYIKQNIFNEMNDKLISLSNQMGCFIKYLENCRIKNNFKQTR